MTHRALEGHLTCLVHSFQKYRKITSTPSVVLLLGWSSRTKSRRTIANLDCAFVAKTLPKKMMGPGPPFATPLQILMARGPGLEIKWNVEVNDVVDRRNSLLAFLQLTPCMEFFHSDVHVWRQAKIFFIHVTIFLSSLMQWKKFHTVIKT